MFKHVLIFRGPELRRLYQAAAQLDRNGPLALLKRLPDGEEVAAPRLTDTHRIHGAAICLVCQPDPINVSPSHVSIFLPAPAGSVMGMVSTVRGDHCQDSQKCFRLVNHDNLPRLWLLYGYFMVIIWLLYGQYLLILGGNGFP